MMKNTWKRVLKNNQSYLSDPEKQKVLRFAMQRPALYLNELEACMEQILAEALEEAEKTTYRQALVSHQRATSRKSRAESIRALAPDKDWNFDFLARPCHGGTIKGACV